MGQKTHPVGFRLGIVRAWHANRYDDKSFSNKLQEDALVRNYVRNRLKKAGIARVQIDRTPKRAVVTIHTSRPGIVIGKSGKEIAQLEEELKKVTSKEIKILNSRKSNVRNWMHSWLPKLSPVNSKGEFLSGEP